MVLFVVCRLPPSEASARAGEPSMSVSVDFRAISGVNHNNGLPFN